MKDNFKKRAILMWTTLVACFFELIFAILLAIFVGTAKLIFAVLLAATSVIIIALSISTILSDKKSYEKLEHKIDENNSFVNEHKTKEGSQE